MPADGVVFLDLTTKVWLGVGMLVSAGIVLAFLLLIAQARAPKLPDVPRYRGELPPAPLQPIRLAGAHRLEGVARTPERAQLVEAARTFMPRRAGHLSGRAHCPHPEDAQHRTVAGMDYASSSRLIKAGTEVVVCARCGRILGPSGVRG